MREIKFRAWHSTLKEWHYFSLVDLMIGRIKDTSLRYEGWGQYMGLTDKNNKEIYEGDIFYIKEGVNLSIICLEGCFGFKGAIAPIVYQDKWDMSKREIIGNRVENPEL